MSSVDLRAATSADRTLLLELCAAYRREDRQPAAEALVEGAVDLAIAGDPHIRLFVIERGGEAVGYLALTIGFSIEAGGRDAFVDEVYVREAARGRGVGARAIEAAFEQCSALGVKRLSLEVERHNPRARALYERLGFRDHDRFLMSRRIGG